jgi:hypothetical protein
MFWLKAGGRMTNVRGTTSVLDFISDGGKETFTNFDCGDSFELKC